MGDTKKREFENFVGGSSHDAGDSDDNKFRKIDQDIERQFREGRNFYPDMDPKNLKEMIARQSSSQGSNQKKAPNVAELEMEVKALKTRIGFIYSQIEAYENKSLSLLIENQAIKLQLVAEEKRRLLQEVEFEKNMEELMKLNGLTRTEVDVLTEMMGQNSIASFNSNSIPSSSNQAKNGDE